MRIQIEEIDSRLENQTDGATSLNYFQSEDGGFWERKSISPEPESGHFVVDVQVHNSQDSGSNPSQFPTRFPLFRP